MARPAPPLPAPPASQGHSSLPLLLVPRRRAPIRVHPVGVSRALCLPAGQSLGLSNRTVAAPPTPPTHVFPLSGFSHSQLFSVPIMFPPENSHCPPGFLFVTVRPFSFPASFVPKRRGSRWALNRSRGFPIWKADFDQAAGGGAGAPEGSCSNAWTPSWAEDSVLQHSD